MIGLGMAIGADAFRDFELAGWQARADGYHRFFEPITGRVIDRTPGLGQAGVRTEGELTVANQKVLKRLGK